MLKILLLFLVYVLDALKHHNPELYELLSSQLSTLYILNTELLVFSENIFSSVCQITVQHWIILHQ
jgi:hypothetical protein